jgi:DNA polymerase-3 subunit gamma/tau
LADNTTDTPDNKHPEKDAAYRVLARKYRPSTFDELLGQEAMVQTLSNAFEAGRIAQAYMLTGVRGIGKTTTARLIARALNYVTADGTSKPTTDFSEPGLHCRAIMESQHVDVMEMDAASHTGVSDVREIIDAVRYKPVSAPYKVYIIDEIHMLSKSAFNALLKTLEEPPEHVKFVFATTEVRRVPVTVLSRCQRFDLRRFDTALMVQLLEKVAGKEKVSVQAEALQFIARAAEGSARDGLSLLDQAIAYGGDKVATKDVQSMLGLVDRGRVIDLFEAIMGGNIADGLEKLTEQYVLGADPHTILNDFAGFVHWVTRIKVVPKTVDDASFTQEERRRGKEMAEKLSMPVLTRAWQMALKGLGEVATSPNAIMATEMVFIRLAYAADLPSPADLVEELKNQPAGNRAPAPGGGTPSSNNSPQSGPTQSGQPQAGGPTGGGNIVQMAPRMKGEQAVRLENETPPVGNVPAPLHENFSNFDDVVALVGKMRDIKLKTNLEKYVRPIRVSLGKIEIALEPGAGHGLAGELSRKMESWTGQRWMVLVTRDGGAEPIQKQRENQRDTAFRQAREHDVVKSVFELFPGAEIVDVRDLDLQQGDFIDSDNDGEDNLIDD